MIGGGKVIQLETRKIPRAGIRHNSGKMKEMAITCRITELTLTPILFIIPLFIYLWANID
jgi:hypothetical protein